MATICASPAPYTSISPLVISLLSIGAAYGSFAGSKLSEEDQTQPDSSFVGALPNELVHHIFQFAAESSPETCRALALVASWARKIALPHLQPTVILQAALDNDSFTSRLSTITSSPSSWTLPAQYARNVWFNPGYRLDEQESAEAVANIFSKCPNATRLALSGESFYALAESSEDSISQSNSPLDVTILPGWHSQEYAAFSGADVPTSKLFQRVTHLRHTTLHLIDEFNLSAFTSLTHLAVSVDPNMFQDGFLCDFMDYIHKMDKLEMVVLVASFDPQDSSALIGARASLCDMMKLARKEDSRFFLWQEQSTDETFQSWKDAAGSGASLWEKAVTYSHSLGLDC